MNIEDSLTEYENPIFKLMRIEMNPNQKYPKEINTNSLIDNGKRKNSAPTQIQEAHKSKPKQSVIDEDNMDLLPTFINILKGKSKLLPSPKKKKYEE